MTSRLDAAHSIVLRTGVPTGWHDAAVADVARIVGGGTPEREQLAFWRDGTIPWITPTDLTTNASKYISRGAEPISELGLASSNATLLPVGSIVFSTRGTVGNMAISAVPLTTNQSCEGIVPRSGVIDGQFLYYLLRFGLSAFIRLSGGTTFGSITRRDIARVRFAIPDHVTEQVAIADVLRSVDNAYELSRTVLDHSRRLYRALLHELFRRGIPPAGATNGTHPAHWETHRLDELAQVGSGVTLGQDVSGFKSMELPYLRVANVQDGHLDLSTIKTVRVRVDQVDDYRLEPGDVLMTEGGDIDKLGRGTIWSGQIANCLHQNHVFRIRPNRAALLPEFYSLVVESDVAKRYFSRVAKRTTNLASTNKTQVRAFRFPVPPTTTEQGSIVELMDAARARVAGLVARHDALRALRDALIDDLISGRSRFSFPERRLA